MVTIDYCIRTSFAWSYEHKRMLGALGTKAVQGHRVGDETSSTETPRLPADLAYVRVFFELHDTSSRTPQGYQDSAVDDGRGRNSVLVASCPDEGC